MRPTAPIFTPSLAQLVDDLLDRSEHRAERDDDRLRVLAAVAAHQPTGGAAERLLELGGDLGHDVERLHLLRVHEVLDLGERLGADHRADRHRIVRVEHLPRLERRQERVDLLLASGASTALDGVREDEAVHAHHHRERELLGELERLHVEVDGLLVRLGVELDPAAVALRHRVASGRSRC